MKIDDIVYHLSDQGFITKCKLAFVEPTLLGTDMLRVEILPVSISKEVKGGWCSEYGRYYINKDKSIYDQRPNILFRSKGEAIRSARKFMEDKMAEAFSICKEWNTKLFDLQDYERGKQC